MGRSPFQMADGRAGGAAYPGAFDLSAVVLALGRLSSTTTSRFPDTTFVGLQNFQQVIDDPLAWSSLVLTVLVASPSSPSSSCSGSRLALAMVKTFRGRGVIMSILIIPLFISPVIVGQSWALFLQRPFGPADYLLSQLLGHPVDISWVGEVPWVYIADRPRRRLAMDAVHVRHPARGAGGHPAPSLRGGGTRRRRRAPDLSLCDAAAARTDHPARRHASACSTRSSSSTSSSC